MNFVIKGTEWLKFEGLTSKSDLHKYLDKWAKIGIKVGICLSNNQDNSQLQRFTTSKNNPQSFRGLLFSLTP